MDSFLFHRCIIANLHTSHTSMANMEKYSSKSTPAPLPMMTCMVLRRTEVDFMDYVGGLLDLYSFVYQLCEFHCFITPTKKKLCQV